MDKNLQNIEDLFRSALDDNEEIPSRNIWETVDKRLDKDNIVSIKRKYTNLKKVAVLLLLLLLSFTLYEVNFIYKNKRLATNKIAQRNKYSIVVKNKLNSSVLTDTAKAETSKKKNETINNYVDDGKEPDSHQMIVITDSHTLQKQNTIEKVTIETGLLALAHNLKKKIA